MVQVVTVLRNELRSAVREEILTRNVARLVTVTTPKYQANRGLTGDLARGPSSKRRKMKGSTRSTS